MNVFLHDIDLWGWLSITYLPDGDGWWTFFSLVAEKDAFERQSCAGCKILKYSSDRNIISFFVWWIGCWVHNITVPSTGGGGRWPFPVPGSLPCPLQTNQRDAVWCPSRLQQTTTYITGGWPSDGLYCLSSLRFFSVFLSSFCLVSCLSVCCLSVHLLPVS